MNINLPHILKAIANEKRFMILHWLKNPKERFVSSKCDVEVSGVCVGLIEKKIGLSQSTVSHYLIQLQKADLITMKREGQWTFCKLNHKTIDAFIKEIQFKL